jgi:LuxR family transcriptional regulator, maltose regulon positive regulatory protein
MILCAAPEQRHGRPRVRERLVPRTTLIRRLTGSSDVPLVLVVAPGGYGKTTVLSQWDDHDSRPFAWITLDEGDNDSGRLLASVASVLDAIEPVDRSLRAALAAPRPKAPDLLPMLVSALQDRSRRFVLVLDDVHMIRNEKSLRALATIADNMPWGSQLALASREEPRVAVGRRRANRNIVELRFRDLVMTSSQSAELLRLTGIQLDRGSLDSIVEVAEGWPAALYLATLSLGRCPDSAAATRFGGDDRLIADYLRDEVLSGLVPDRLEFLRRTAVLDLLSPSLCDAILEGTDSARVLAELERSHVLVFPADEPGYHRYHRLFAGLLRAELRAVEPELEPELHRRAARWHGRRGDTDSAIAHAVSARDGGLAGDLMWANLLRYVSQGRHSPVPRWLDGFTDEEIGAHPSLALVAAGHQIARGDRNLAEHWTSAAAQRVREGRRGAKPALEGGVAVLRAAAGTDGIVRMIEDASSAYQLFAEDDPWRSLCCFLVGTGRHLSGARDRAEAWLEEGARRGTVNAPSIRAMCLAQLALLRIDEGDWENAHIHALRARIQIERFAILDYPTSALVLAVASTVFAQAGRVDEATIDTRRAARLAGELDEFAPWYETEIRIVLARTALRLGDVAGAGAQAAHASRLLRHGPDVAVLHEWLHDLVARTGAAAGHPKEDGWSLTTAELRVLQFLPTHLSLPEIARELNVSTNTVKTHTRAVYRKLDASSRTEAVTQARGAGLIDVDRLALAEAA